MACDLRSIARMRRRVLLAVVLAAGVIGVTAPALARTQQDIPYPTERVWNAAVRLLRLDLGCTITERDVEVGYVMFEYRDGARSFPGSIELLRAAVDDVPDATRVFVSIPAMPRYIEIMIADRLARKMVDEYGEPVRRPRVQAGQTGQAQQGASRTRDGARRDGRETDGAQRGGRSSSRTTSRPSAGTSRSRTSSTPSWPR